jgi:hypothetical protein
VKSSMAGWIAFAGIVMMIIGGLDAIQGLVAIIDDNYYVSHTGIVFESKDTWGWLLLIWGIIVALAGYGLLAGASWARWFAIFAVALQFLAELSFPTPNVGVTLWGLVVLALDIIVLYALIARWEESKAEMGGGYSST